MLLSIVQLLFKEWIDGIENPDYDKTISKYLNTADEYIKGTNCYSNEFSGRGYFHRFLENNAIIEKLDGSIIIIEHYMFKFDDSPNDEKRFYAACAAMQGISACGIMIPPNAAKLAFEYADELIKQEQL